MENISLKKSKVKHSPRQQGTQQARNNILKKFLQIDKQVQSEIQRFAQEQLQADLEERRSALRLKQAKEIQQVHHVLSFLY